MNVTVLLRWPVLIVTITFGLTSILGHYEPTQALAEIRFEEVTQAAGIDHAGTTWGASWGDFNSDGWPDLWVGNHDSKPSLYVNQQDGRFVDVIDRVWAADPRADTHGAAWADFDNDGDQDLVELVDVLLNEDGTFCIGCGRNHLFVNENGSLVEKAKEFGLNRVGSGVSPLWFDADRDGRLDLLIVNTRQGGRGHLPTSTFFHQGPEGFKESNAAFRFRDAGWSRRRDLVPGLLQNALRLHFKKIHLLHVDKNLEFAQFADLTDDGHLDLILFSLPTRVYSVHTVPMTEVTATVEFPPRLEAVSDVAIGDFNGDGKLDMYLTRGERRVSDVIQVTANEIKGTLTAGQNKTVFFRSEGPIELHIYPTWLSLSKVFIGSVGRHPSTRSFSLSPADPEVRGPESADIPERGAVSITYDPGSHIWTLLALKEYVDFIVRSMQPITDLRTLGFKPFQEEDAAVDALLIRRRSAYVLQQLPGEAGGHTACHSVGAGDFDNDMDVDLYLVCEGPVENLPNRLLENDGKGNFRLVPDAGGASGSHLGRGDVVAIADYDRDGFLDLFITNGADPTSPFVADGPHQLFRNRGNDNHWLEIDLEGVQSNRDGIGARVTIEAGGVQQIREQRGGMHRLSQNHQRIHVGLGKNDMVDRLVVRWPSGVVQEIRRIAADRILRIREEDGLMMHDTQTR